VVEQPSPEIRARNRWINVSAVFMVSGFIAIAFGIFVHSSVIDAIELVAGIGVFASIVIAVRWDRREGSMTESESD
jgi:hypothetical protein